MQLPVLITQKMSNHEDSSDEHLEDVPDGAGCTEIWEHLSETRENTD